MISKGSKILPPMYSLSQETTRGSASPKRGHKWRKKQTWDTGNRGCRRLRKFPGVSERMLQSDSCAAALNSKSIFKQEDGKLWEKNPPRGEHFADWFVVFGFGKVF